MENYTIVKKICEYIQCLESGTIICLFFSPPLWCNGLSVLALSTKSQGQIKDMKIVLFAASLQTTQHLTVRAKTGPALLQNNEFEYVACLHADFL